MVLKNSSKRVIENVIFGLCSAVALVFLIALISNCFIDNVWFDEVFSLYIIDNSFVDLIKNTALDVHPPLYYLILKFFVEIITFVFPAINVVVVAKFISLLSFVLLFFFIYFVASKEFPKIVTGLLLLMFFAFNGLEDLTIEIRMYGYSALFLFICFFYTLRIIKYDGKIKDWILFVVFFECSAYTHNFSMIAAVMLALFLLIYFVFCDRKKLLKTFLFVMLCAVLYLPWFIVLIKQITTIHGNYWIEYTPILGIVKYLFYFELFKLPDLIIYPLVYAFLILTLILFVLNCRSKRIEKKTKWVLSIGFFVTVMFFVFGILTSIAMDPIFIERYTNCIFALFYMSALYNFYLFFMATIKLSSFKKFQIIASIFLCVFVIYFVSAGIVNLVDVRKENKHKQNQYVKLETILQDYEFDNLQLIFDNNMVQDIVEYRYFDSETLSFGFKSGYCDYINGYSHKPSSIAEIESFANGCDMLFFSCYTNVESVFSENIKTELIDRLAIGNDMVDLYLLTKVES